MAGEFSLLLAELQRRRLSSADSPCCSTCPSIAASPRPRRASASCLAMTARPSAMSSRSIGLFAFILVSYGALIGARVLADVLAQRAASLDDQRLPDGGLGRLLAGALIIATLLIMALLTILSLGFGGWTLIWALLLTAGFAASRSIPSAFGAQDHQMIKGVHRKPRHSVPARARSARRAAGICLRDRLSARCLRRRRGSSA